LFYSEQLLSTTQRVRLFCFHVYSHLFILQSSQWTLDNYCAATQVGKEVIFISLINIVTQPQCQTSSVWCFSNTPTPQMVTHLSANLDWCSWLRVWTFSTCWGTPGCNLDSFDIYVCVFIGQFTGKVLTRVTGLGPWKNWCDFEKKNSMCFLSFLSLCLRTYQITVRNLKIIVLKLKVIFSCNQSTSHSHHETYKTRFSLGLHLKH